MVNELALDITGRIFYTKFEDNRSKIATPRAQLYYNIKF